MTNADTTALILILSLPLEIILVYGATLFVAKSAAVEGGSVGHALTKEFLAEAIQTIYSGYAEGKTDEQLAAEIGIDANEFKKLRLAMFDSKAEEVRARPTEHVYVQYMIDQARNIKDLTDMIKDFKSTRQHTAMVAAVKTRADIYDRLIKRGQEFGFIARDPKSGNLGLGELLGELTNKQLRVKITMELKQLGDLMVRYGDKNILEMPTGSLHHGPRLPRSEMEDDRTKHKEISAPGASVKKKSKKGAAAKKTARAKNVKRHAGRVKAKPPGPTSSGV